MTIAPLLPDLKAGGDKAKLRGRRLRLESRRPAAAVNYHGDGIQSNSRRHSSPATRSSQRPPPRHGLDHQENDHPKPRIGEVQPGPFINSTITGTLEAYIRTGFMLHLGQGPGEVGRFAEACPAKKPAARKPAPKKPVTLNRLLKPKRRNGPE